MRVFASETLKKVMGRFGIPEDEPIESSMITRSLEKAQERIEGFNFDSRKQVLAYDDVMNTQRLAIYARRRAALLGDEEAIEWLLRSPLLNQKRTSSVMRLRPMRAVSFCRSLICSGLSTLRRWITCAARYRCAPMVSEIP